MGCRIVESHTYAFLDHLYSLNNRPFTVFAPAEHACRLFPFLPVTWPAFGIRSFPQVDVFAELHGEPWGQIWKGGTLQAMVELLKRASTLQRQGPKYDNQLHALEQTNLTYKSEKPP